MTIGIAGTGRVARALGCALHLSGFHITIAGRDPLKTAAAAQFISSDTIPANFSQLPDHVLIAVTDSAICEVAAQLNATTKLTLHTSGVSGADILQELQVRGTSCGSLHPLQTFSDDRTSLEGIPFAISGDAPAAAWAESLAIALHGQILRIPNHQRPLYHAAAALASNGLIALLDTAAITLERTGIPYPEALAALAPILRATLENALARTPQKALTGPILRGDSATLSLHLLALKKSHPEALPLYRALSRHLLKIARTRGLSNSQAGKVQDSLNDD